MDLEEIVRKLIREGHPENDIKSKLLEFGISEEEADAIIEEVKNIEGIPEGFIKRICNYPSSGFSASKSGLGCRGKGDFVIHHAIAEVIGETEALVDPISQDDGGIIETEHGFISAAVDGMHSRLSHFPFLAGFHAARAAVRDVLVMGGYPVAILSDIHIGDDGDVGKVLDYTAGAGALSELLNIPLIGGSTLRIGGDLVKGDRLTGCIMSMGTSSKLTARRSAEKGDVLVLTEGSGGGTITTTALYNGYYDVLLETLDVKTIEVCMKLIKTPIIDKIHSMTDITNGGIRGDAAEFSNSSELKIIIDGKKVTELIEEQVLNMLNELDIDPLGISTDSLLFSLSPEYSEDLISFLNNNGVAAQIVGRIDQGKGVFIRPVKKPSESTFLHKTESEEELIELQDRFREAPYTPVKKVAGRFESDIEGLKTALNEAKYSTKSKKKEIVEWIKSKVKKYEG